MSKENQCSPKIIPIIQTIVPESSGVLNLKFIQKDQYLNELLYIQYQVNQQLLINKFLTQGLFKSADQLNGKAYSSQGSTLPGNAEKNDKNKKQKYCYEVEKKKQNIKTKRTKQNSQSEYQPSQQQEILVHHKLSESKNVPKNYGKSITNFISKNQKYVKKVLNKCLINEQEFKVHVTNFKNQINTIAELRQIWIQSKNNPYSRPLRIISMQYLRKHCLSHIFNSRVQNYAKHIKYRQKITKAIQKPEQFTQMKDF